MEGNTQIQRLVIATHNARKAGEMVRILAKRFPKLPILTLADYPGAPEPEETGADYAENAAIKARSASSFTGEWCLADDAGLEIDALEGAPGLHSKRFGGEGLSFPEKMARILELLEKEPASKRTARFRCRVALCAPGGEVTSFEATCEGRIAFEAKGSGGFGYDPIFYLPRLGSHMAELSADEKDAVSHRGKVLRKVGDYLEPALDG